MKEAHPLDRTMQYLLVIFPILIGIDVEIDPVLREQSLQGHALTALLLVWLIKVTAGICLAITLLFFRTRRSKKADGEGYRWNPSE